ncbi:Replication factor C subunit 1 [Nakaseomyces bracarensis]|uniref:Replication factor C subunit 1 n=1 Tax=Nakaseomyces bracarensis TaxID=273131 RepID=A0ABR4NXK7_9SACH
MVNITDFFGGKKSAAKAKPKKAPEVIDLEDDDDLLEEIEKVTETKPEVKEESKDAVMREPRASKVDTKVNKSATKQSSPVKKDSKPELMKETQQPTPVKNENITAMKKEAIPPALKKDIKPEMKKEEVKSDMTAQDVLDTIPSVDLDNVHVKENVTFDFKNRGGNEQESEPMDTDFPEGRPNCLLGLTVVFTGTLPTVERGAAENLAKRYGARVTKSISKKTSVVVLGDEAGPKKLEKIKELKIKAIDEEGFKQLIAGMPAEGGSGDAAEKAKLKLEEQEKQAIKEAEEMERAEKEKELKRKQELAKNKKSGNVPLKQEIREEDKLWTVKYAPKNLQQICGNKTSVNKLKNWLSNWETNKQNGFKNAGRDGTGIYRAAMLYGPPGIGKTTAAHLVAQELGYDVLEQNASDVRSKSLLNDGVKNALDNFSIVGLLKSNSGQTSGSNGSRFVIVMDEVDGMSGGDRGGVGQLAQFCRKTSTPLILICNERTLPKMRPFDRVCLDIQFRRPDANSVKARLMTIAVREKFKLDPNIIDKLVQATRGDIRQIINLLSTVSKTTKTINHANIADISSAWEKNIALKPFDIAHRLLDGSIYTELGSQRFTLNDKIMLYFDDFDFAPLMIQENYLNTRPSVLNKGQTHLQAVAEAADSISQGDLVERKIRSSEQLWGLLPLHAVLSSVRPASKVAGQMAGRINFSSWLGQNSKMGKYFRLLQELQYHTRLSTSANKFSFRMEYMPTLKRKLLNPLVKEGADAIDSVIDLLDEYYLTKEDWDTIMEFMVGPDVTEALIKKIPTAVKSAFTRKYNSMTHPVAIYRTGTTVGVSSGSREKPDFEDVVDADDNVPANDENTQDDNDLKKDKLIKQKAKPKKRAAAGAKSTATKKRKTKQ